MDFDSQELKQCVKSLKEIDLELAYLALLTREGLKPLSRWEKPLDDNGLGLLQQMGLLTKQIRRTVKTGRQVTETVFSTTAGYIQVYEKRFGNMPIDKSATTVRFEGFLFGFPPCCVDEYIRHPYIKNAPAREQQEILFHWACKDCKITPALLFAYESIYNFLNSC
ncbi:MAG: hypothetical protein JSV82_00330 [Planctomycetota bacterium]|nr:MAG: hypothetical protein JSV82_00330 [Planctomycetota bacterium]